MPVNLYLSHLRTYAKFSCNPVPYSFSKVSNPAGKSTINRFVLNQGTPKRYSLIALLATPNSGERQIRHPLKLATVLHTSPDQPQNAAFCPLAPTFGGN